MTSLPASLAAPPPGRDDRRDDDSAAAMARALDNVFWQALAGPQRALALGGDTARRFAPGLPPIAAFADNTRPDLAALAAVCSAGEALYTGGWSGPAPTGWTVAVDARMHRMAWPTTRPAPSADGAADPDADRAWRVLRPADAPAAYALATLTRPGPLAPRVTELGEYLGCFDAQGRLLAMAGERVRAGAWREVSGVCTHPDAQGRGLARGLLAALVGRILARGDRPFLHVMTDNVAAHRLYEQLGFVDVAEPAARVLVRG